MRPNEPPGNSQPAAAAGDPAGVYSLAAEGLADHGEHGSLHYAALAGERERALDHLHRACALNPEARKWAATASDLDTLRADPAANNSEARCCAEASPRFAAGRIPLSLKAKVPLAASPWMRSSTRCALSRKVSRPSR